MSSSLVGRFIAGSNGGLVTPPFGVRFTKLSPSDNRLVEQLHLSVLHAHSEIYNQIRTGFSLSTTLLASIGDYLDSLDKDINRGFETVTYAVEHLEESLCAELSQIRWVLGNIDEKLGTLIHLTAFPRETESREIIMDGLNFLSVGYLEDAEKCFRAALERKPWNFDGEYSLAFVYLANDQVDKSIDHFNRAVACAPIGKDGALKIMSLESLARAYFAGSDPERAMRTMEEALALRALQGTESARSNYLCAVYSANAGNGSSALDTIIGLCRTNPRYIPLAATDADLEPIREQLLIELDTLVQDARDAACTAYNSFVDAYRSMTQADHAAVMSPYSDLLCFLSVQLEIWIQGNIYSDLCAVVSAAGLAVEMIQVAPRWYSAVITRGVLTGRISELRERLAEIDGDIRSRIDQLEEEAQRANAMSGRTAEKSSDSSDTGIQIAATIGMVAGLLGGAVYGFQSQHDPADPNSGLNAVIYAVFMAAIGGAIVGPVAILLVYLIGYSAKLIFAVIAEKHYDKRAGTLRARMAAVEREYEGKARVALSSQLDTLTAQLDELKEQCREIEDAQRARNSRIEVVLEQAGR